MKKLLPIFAVAVIAIACSCNYIWHETIQGNGNVTTENRNISDAVKIKSLGSFDVDIEPGATASVKIEADENLMPYIITENKDGWLVIRSKDHVNLSSNNKILVHIVTPELQETELDGSGNVTGSGKFMNADHLKLSIAGSGNITLAVNTPIVEASIAGTGDIRLSGETKDIHIDIAGVGNCEANNMKAENAEVHIAGSGDVKVFASTNLEVHIAGSGDVYYVGNPTISQDIAGSGTIKPLQ